MLLSKRSLSSPIVESYWIEKYDSGIIHLLINTVNKWVNYHRSSNTTYEIGFNNAEDDFPGYQLDIPELEEILKKGSYLPTEFQEKDQISFYFIPYKLIR